MTSYANDRSTSDFITAAGDLLVELDHSSHLLATSAVVPPEVEALVDSLDERVHARAPEVAFATVDPFLAEGLLGGVIVCLKALRHDDEVRARRDLRIGLEQVRQALRDALDEQAVHIDRTPKELVLWLADTTSVPQADLAEVLGVAPRTLQRWLASTDAGPRGDDAMRVQAVARVVSHLRHSFTGPGTLRWLQRPHPALGDAAPLTLLDDPGGIPAVVELAARARSMVAA